MSPLSQLADLPHLIERVVSHFGYLGLAILMLVENLVPPIPSELILPLAGFLVTLGRMDLVLVLTVSTAGSLTGALVLYGAGRAVGEDRLKSLLARHGRPLGFREEAFERGAMLLRRHSAAVLFWGRFVPGLRSVISLPAGLVRVPLPTFIGWTLLGSLCWNAALVGAGLLLGDNWTRMLSLMDRYETALAWTGVVALVAAVAYASFAARRLRRAARARRD